MESQPFQALSPLAKTLRDEGMSQVELYRLYDAALARYRGDPDDMIYDAIVDTMDFIVVWCQPGHRLFASDLREGDVT